MLDVGGQDATEAFEDVGHSDEARETLDTLLVGKLERKVCFVQFSIFVFAQSSMRAPPSSLPLLRSMYCIVYDFSFANPGQNFPFHQAGDPTPKTHNSGSLAPQAQTGAASGMGIGLYAVILIGGLAAYAAYQYLQQQQQQTASA